MTDTARTPLRVLVYSDDATVRAAVTRALGTHPDPDLPELTYVEVATAPVVIEHLDAGGVDLVILDGEATPAGGMGIAIPTCGSIPAFMGSRSTISFSLRISLRLQNRYLYRRNL